MTRTLTAVAAALTALDRPDDRPDRDRLILDALTDADPAVRDLAVAWAARCLEPAVLVPLVAEDADAVLRNAALAALERQGPYAVSAVEGLVGDPDPDVAMFACQVLGAIGTESSGKALLVALGRAEANVVQAAAEAAGRLRAAEALPALCSLLDREPWLQLAALDALGALGDEDAVDPLLALVPDSFVAEPAIDALGRLGSPRVLPVLVPLLLDDRYRPLWPALVLTVGGIAGRGPVAGLAEFGRTVEANRDDGSLWKLLADYLAGLQEAAPPVAGAEDDRVRPRGGGRSVRAAGALVFAAGMSTLLGLVLRQAGNPDGVAWVRILAERYPDLPSRGGTALLAHPDPDVRAGALRVLAPTQVGSERLIAALADPDSRVRVAAIEGLGALGRPDLAGAIAAQLEAPGATERNAAVRALARLPAALLTTLLQPAFEAGASETLLTAALGVLAETEIAVFEERVVALATTGAAPVRRAALRATARLSGSRAGVVLLRALADRDSSLQAEALDLLVARDGARILPTLLALLGAADSLRYHVIRALGRLASPEAVTPLQRLFASAALHEQLEILTALTRIGSGHCRDFFLSCLDHAHPEVRRAAAQGLAAIAGAGDLELLTRFARSPDWVMRTEAARALGRLALPGGEPALLDLARDLEPVVARTARAALAGPP